jgi:hypothetical protein
MGVASAAGGGSGFIFVAFSLSLLGHELKKEELRGTFDYFSILICDPLFTFGKHRPLA